MDKGPKELGDAKVIGQLGVRLCFLVKEPFVCGTESLQSKYPVSISGLDLLAEFIKPEWRTVPM